MVALLPIETRRAHLRRHLPDLEWSGRWPLIEEIEALKLEHRAVILAHNYQTPDLFHGVADITGDSLALARRAAEVEADTIVMCGVHFMAETAKLMNPDRRVLIPSLRAGCSLAESICAEDLRALRKRYPGVPVVVYVNTSAEVKAEADICCTSANAVAVVESLDAERVIFAPDRYLGQYVASQTEVELILWDGACEVHERFTGAQLRGLREDHPGLYLIAHPECPQDVLAEADFTGSTQGMVEHLARVRPARVALITECSMSDNVAVEFPEIEFTRPCNLCPHMKQIRLEGVRDALLSGRHEVHIAPHIAGRAPAAVQRMLDVGRREVA